MPELERWVLHRLAELDELVREKIEAYDFHALFVALHNFCAVELSAFYFDVRKDSLYCDADDSVRRRSVRTVMEHLFSALTAWLAPVLCFTAEEAWLARPEGLTSGEGWTADSVHLRDFPTIPAAWRNDDLAAKWSVVRGVRRVVTGALELERANKTIGSSLQANPTVYVDSATKALLADVDFQDVCITSAIAVVEGTAPDGAFTLADVAGIAVASGLADGEKCERCWKVLPEVSTVADHPTLCVRCAEAVG
jgi:isoleucyl-tRNA synthetase